VDAVSITPAEVNAELRRGLHLALLMATDPEAFMGEARSADAYPATLAALWYAGELARRVSAEHGVEIDAVHVLRDGLAQVDVEDAMRDLADDPTKGARDIRRAVITVTDDDRAAAVALYRAGLQDDDAGIGAIVRSCEGGDGDTAARLFIATLALGIRLGINAHGTRRALDAALLQRLHDLAPNPETED
jgi:hypothetical protein